MLGQFAIKNNSWALVTIDFSGQPSYHFKMQVNQIDINQRTTDFGLGIGPWKEREPIGQPQITLYGEATEEGITVGLRNTVEGKTVTHKKPEWKPRQVVLHQKPEFKRTTASESDEWRNFFDKYGDKLSKQARDLKPRDTGWLRHAIIGEDGPEPVIPIALQRATLVDWADTKKSIDELQKSFQKIIRTKYEDE